MTKRRVTKGRALRRSLQLFFISLSGLLLAACAAEFSVPFLLYGNGEEPERAVRTLREDEITPERLVYELERPVVAAESGRDLVLSVLPGFDIHEVRLLDPEGQTVSEGRFDHVLEAFTPEHEPEREIVKRLHLPLPPDRPVVRLDLRPGETDGAQPERSEPTGSAGESRLPFDTLSLTPRRSGFSLDSEGPGDSPEGSAAVLALGSDTLVLDGVTGGERRDIEVFLRPPTADEASVGAAEVRETAKAPSYLSVRYRFEEGDGGEPRVVTALLGCAGEGTGADSRRSYHLTLRPGTHTLYFHASGTDCSPRRLQIPAAPPELAILQAELRTMPSDRDTPIPADLGTILESYPREAWRDPRYELFSWNLFPEILVMDTRSYQVQAAFFRRLAFFVEKRGYRGRLLGDAELETLHGWNAHNYRPEGLAPFYNSALERGFELNQAERELKRLLLANGVLRPAAGDRVEPGRGGLISVSRESFPALRELLLTHEAFHGVFYAVPEFRRGAREIWRKLTEEERAFWRALLSFMTYDPADEYLMVNEFQAYLLQQTPAGTRSYLRGTLSGRLARRRPRYVEGFLSDYPQTFLRSAEEMNTLALETAGLRGGEVYDLRPR